MKRIKLQMSRGTFPPVGLVVERTLHPVCTSNQAGQLNGLVEIAFRALMRAACGIDHRLFGDVVLRSELAENVEKCVILPRLREAHTASAHGVQHPCREHRRSRPRSRRAMGRQGAGADPAYDICPQARNGREVNQAMAVIGPDRRSLLEN